MDRSMQWQVNAAVVLQALDAGWTIGPQTGELRILAENVYSDIAPAALDWLSEAACDAADWLRNAHSPEQHFSHGHL